MVRVTLLPLLDSETEVVGVFLGEDRTLLLVQFCAAGGVRQDRVFDDVLMDGFHQRVVGNGLDEYGPALVAGSGGHVYLQSQPAVLLEHPVVDVLDGFEPRHLRVVDVVGFVVEDGQLANFADDLSEIRIAVGGLADRLGTERLAQEVFAEVFVFHRRFRHLAEKHSVDIRQEEVAGFLDDSHIVLDV